MKLIVLGATGGVGRQIVKQAADRGHKVTAFVRAPERLKEYRDRIEIIQGDLLSPAELARVILGHDAVLSTFGPRVPLSKADWNLLHRFGVALSNAMQSDGTRRAVIISTAFLFKDSILPPANLVGSSSVRSSKTPRRWNPLFRTADWTLVRPPRLTDRPRRGRFRVREGHLPGFGFTISRADVAAFMLKTAENGAFVQKIVGISN